MNNKLLKPIIFIVFIIFSYVLISSRATTKSPKQYVISGYTMGTTYTVKLANIYLSEKQLINLRSKINKTLESVNKQMSTFDSDSEISLFNNYSSDAPVKISEDFAKVMKLSQQISRKTDGAFDPTLSPLINLWGFGNTERTNSVPSKKDISKALKNVGYKYVILKESKLIKKNPHVQLNLSAIAKGYGVDKLAEVISSTGCKNYMVEVGGEVVCSGLNESGKVWRIGIQDPEYNSEVGSNNIMIISLKNKAIATSGDYRNYFVYKGKNYSHVIDPRTGYPAEANVASSSVIADNCALADALATSLMVMGPKKGLALIEMMPNVEAMVSVRNRNGSFTNYETTGFDSFAVK